MKNRISGVLLVITCSLCISYCHSNNFHKVLFELKTNSLKNNERITAKAVENQSTDPDIIITEIMYNSSGTDDEWIELCNFSGSTQQLDGIIIKINATTIFTFPTNSYLDNEDCITIALGDNATAPFNPDCEFVPDYGSPSATNYLNNSTSSIEIWNASNSTLIDFVTYSDVNGADGNGASLHLISFSVDNSSTSIHWQETQNGGSPGTFSLMSPCSQPQLQLKNSSGQIQDCDSFNLDFESVAVGFTKTLQFKIENDGNLDLIIPSIDVTGDYSISSPNTPLTIVSGSSEVISVMFSPSINGAINSSLTINSNDPNFGSCGINLLGIGYTPAPVINVEGDIGTFPDISNGDSTPSGVDNTLFASQYIGSSQSKGFIISNIGTADLQIFEIIIEGSNPSDFEISLMPDTSLQIGERTFFEISFNPKADGQRNATVKITHNDIDESPFIFSIRGTGICSLNDFVISPNYGPVGTNVSINGIDIINSNVYYDHLLLDVSILSENRAEITIPEGAITSHIKIVDPTGCEGYRLFEILPDKKGGCEGGFYLDELFISEVTDAGYGSLTYIELYNPSNNSIDLNQYSLSIYPNGKTDFDDGYHQPLTGTIKSGEVFIITAGTAGLLGNAVCNNDGGDGSFGHLISSELPGINKVDNKHDFIGLYKESELIDAFGIYGDKNWMLDLPIKINDDRGFQLRRLNSALNIPSKTFNANQWEILDWKVSGQTSCDIYDYTNIGGHDFSTSILPSITFQPTLPPSICDINALITVVGSEGYLGGNTLSYQWYLNTPDAADWTLIESTNSDYDGQQSSTLEIKNAYLKEGYQFFARISEGNDCYINSNSVKLMVDQSSWNGSSWTKSQPSEQSIAIIEGLYTTGVHGIIKACNLIVKPGSKLVVSDNTHIDITNNIYVMENEGNEGKIIVHPKGIVNQIDDNAKSVLASNSNIEVWKETAPAQDWFEYTYWGTPVNYETVDNAFSLASPTRRFIFKAENFLDAVAEINNNNDFSTGQDGIDDDNNSWQFAGGLDLVPGRGYITTHNPNTFGNTGSTPYTNKYIFSGPFNNGDIEVPIYRNDAELNDSNWNLLGNPYPSPIIVDEFLFQNQSLDGIIYLWSQGSLPTAFNNGSEALNFGQDNYAIINGVGEVAGGDMIKPNRYIPSCQGFFVTYSNEGEVLASNGTIKQGSVVFTNSMRTIGISDNEQFFKKRIKAENKIWINLMSESGLFSQTMIAYSADATNKLDENILDAPKIISPLAYLSLFSVTQDSEEIIYAIQARNVLNLINKAVEETISIGYYCGNLDEELKLSIDEIQGSGFEDLDVHLIDTKLGILHNLSISEYLFDSPLGYFTDRFQLIFLEKGFNGIYDELTIDEFVIKHLGAHQLLFKNDTHRIENIEILDYYGRQIYKFKVQDKSIIKELKNLKSTLYIAKIELANSQLLSKKFVIDP